MIYEVAKVVLFKGYADFVAKRKRLTVVFDERKARVSGGLELCRYLQMMWSICFDYKMLISKKYRVFVLYICYIG